MRKTQPGVIRLALQVATCTKLGDEATVTKEPSFSVRFYRSSILVRTDTKIRMPPTIPPSADLGGRRQGRRGALGRPLGNFCAQIQPHRAALAHHRPA